ncbi:MAG: tRNA preQ1(34) S-adenosylmethionine ribosyltransferase-isomerase QueA, partial [Candidatus Omnitrophota bacterium]
KTGEDSFTALTKPSKKLKNGTKILFDNGITGTVLENSDFGKIIKFSDPDGLADIGRVPLPPYIKREPEALDDERYQTVYARNDGATASPTAGLHFTNDLLGKISRSGIDIAYVTLNVSYGTFAPVLEEDVEKHKMHKEYFRLTEDTADVINKTKERGGRVIAVGTTTTRVLESCGGGKVCPGEGTTDLFIYPGYRFKTVDMMLTNFHLPKSTLLLLVSAFAGTEFIKEAYKKAVERNFRFFSYGDCMFIT